RPKQTAQLPNQPRHADRPLPAEMLKYARMDTHYLLRIYDILRTQLLALPPTVPAPQPYPPPATISQLLPTPTDPEPPIVTVLRRSAQTSLVTYARDTYDFVSGQGTGGWRAALRRYGAGLSGEQAEVFRHVHAWREKVAREEDESTAFVMPAAQLVAVSGAMPGDAGAVVGVGGVTALVRKRAAEVAEAVRKGREEWGKREERDKDRRKVEEERRREEQGRVRVHTRFEDGDGDEGGDGDGAAGRVARVALVAKRVPAPGLLAHASLFGTPPPSPAASGSRPSNPPPTPLAARPSSFASALWDSDASDPDSVAARKLADEIRRTLQLAPPSVEVLRRRMGGAGSGSGAVKEEEGMAAPGAAEFVFRKPGVGAGGEAGKGKADKDKDGKESKRTRMDEEEPMVLAEMKKRKLVDGKAAGVGPVVPPPPSEDMIDISKFDSEESSDELPARAGTGAPASVVSREGEENTVGGADPSGESQKKKRKRIKKKKKGVVAGPDSREAVPSTGSAHMSSRPATANEPVEPFDYSKARSAAVDAINFAVKTAERQPRDGKVKYDRDSQRLAEQSDSEDDDEAGKIVEETKKRAKGFNPFKDPETDKKEKGQQAGGKKDGEARLTTAPRGGNKSFSWK
ncbi:exosome nuclease subunit, partial [Gonapodya sp. JEL0774]